MDRVAVYLAVCIVQVIKPGYLQNSLKKDPLYTVCGSSKECCEWMVSYSLQVSIKSLLCMQFRVSITLSMHVCTYTPLTESSRPSVIMAQMRLSQILKATLHGTWQTKMGSTSVPNTLQQPRNRKHPKQAVGLLGWAYCVQYLSIYIPIL